MAITPEGRAMVREFAKVQWDAGNLNVAVRPPLGKDIPRDVYIDHTNTCSGGGKMTLMARDCKDALEAAFAKCEGNEEAEAVLLEFASAVLKTFRHEVHDAAQVYYPEYLTDFGKKVVDEVFARYENDGRSYALTGKNEFTLLPNPYDEEGTL